MIFDLDGMLIPTEHLKAIFHARTALELSPPLAEEEVINAFKEWE